MKASNVKISELKTVDECHDAIEKIESDYVNIVGGIKAWSSGYQTELTAGAIRKIRAIERRIEKIERTTFCDRCSKTIHDCSCFG